ncbi:MAG: minor capsid protein [Lachnospiraceae bacterium]|nr:minor capsid protein [Lachnospiraceae bacterium]
MAQKNSEYWQERFNALNESLLNKGEEYNRELILAYDEAIQNIQKEIEIFYERFAANEMLTLSEAKKILNSQERKAFQMTLNQYIKYGKQNALDGKWIKELESASDIYRMDRLRALQLQMRQQVEILEAKKDIGIADTMSKIYKDGYYKTIYEIQKGLGEGMAFATLDTNKIEKVLSKPWAPDGSTFSQKIWGSDRTNLLYQLDTKFTQALIRGDNPNRIIKEMANTLNVSKSAASRLVMTESAYYASASRKDCYKELDVEEFEYVATLDLKTSSLCQSMDGQHFPMSEYQVGVNAPPLHPWCRSTTVPYFNDEFTADEKRAARGEDGKTYKVPADMKYKNWHDKRVKTNTDMLIQEQKLKNKYSDQKQYEKYKEVLGKNSPKSFDKFQELKYNNSDKWSMLQDYKRSRSSNMISAFTTFEDYKKYKDIINEEIVGIATSNNISIKSQSKHFVERVFGTTQDPKTNKFRTGVDIQDIKQALTNPMGVSGVKEEIDENGTLLKSQKFFGEKATISINPDTGVLIQCNPTDERTRKKWTKLASSN